MPGPIQFNFAFRGFGQSKDDFYLYGGDVYYTKARNLAQ